MRSEQELNRVIDQYGDTVRRICLLYLKNEADSEDIFQTVFFTYISRKIKFNSTDDEDT